MAYRSTPRDGTINPPGAAPARLHAFRDVPPALIAGPILHRRETIPQFENPEVSTGLSGDSGEQLLPRRAAVLDFLHTHSIARFIFATVLFFLLVFVSAWMWAVNGRMWFLDREYPMWLSKSMMVETCSLGDTVIMGDSRPMADLVPEHLGNASNLALGGSVPIEGYYLAERIVRCPELPKRVIVSFAPWHFIKAGVYWPRTALFGFLNREEMEEVRHVSRRLNDPVIYSVGLTGGLDLIKNYSYSVSLPSYYFPAMVNALFVGRKKQNDAILETTLRNRGHHLFGQANGAAWPNNEETKLVAFKPSRLLEHYFDRMITLLGQRGIEVAFMSMPVNERTRAGINPTMLEAFRGFLTAKAERHSNFRAVGEFPPVLDAEYFGDPEHLNERGARMWSDYVKSKLDGLRSASD
jgi:hypothetical protein